MDILVIGSKGHARATCVDWLQPFLNLEEYDSVILDLTSLTQHILDKLVGNRQNQVREIPKAILTLLSTSRNVYSIFIPEVRASPFASPEGHMAFPQESNWDWLPVRPEIEAKTGSSVDHIVEPDLQPYFANVENWSFEINRPRGVRVLSMPIEEYTFAGSLLAARIGREQIWRMSSVAINKSRNNIAAKLLLPEGKSGGIYLLPPPTKCSSHDAIEVLIDILNGSSPEGKPEWWERVEIPKAIDIGKRIKEETKAIASAQEHIEQLKGQKEEAESYRQLLSETDDPLVKVVQRTLKDLGIETEPTPKRFPADLIHKGQIAIEVTGIIDKVTADTPKVGQVLRFREKHYAGEKLVLVVNTYRRDDPAERIGREDFSKEALVLLPPLEVCAITSLTLFALWRDVMTGEREAEEVKRMIFSTVGVLGTPK
ncbi:MAG: hypothetical protein JRM85_05040 [Nitrososphaerota archaeon]|nr:hypothetical protein [Nitrososphaerota archaeon]